MSPLGTPECPSRPSTMHPPRSKGKEHPPGPPQPGAYAKWSSSSSQRTSSLESSPLPEEWRIHPSKETRGKGFQYKRRLWVKNDLNAWHVAKILQHAQNPTKTARRSSFERVLSPPSITLLPNYFDVLSKVGHLLESAARSWSGGTGTARGRCHMPPTSSWWALETLRFSYT